MSDISDMIDSHWEKRAERDEPGFGERHRMGARALRAGDTGLNRYVASGNTIKERMKGDLIGTAKGLGAGGLGGAALGGIAGAVSGKKGQRLKSALHGAALGGAGGAVVGGSVGSAVGRHKAENRLLAPHGMRSGLFSPQIIDKKKSQSLRDKKASAFEIALEKTALTSRQRAAVGGAIGGANPLLGLGTASGAAGGAMGTKNDKNRGGAAAGGGVGSFIGRRVGAAPGMAASMAGAMNDSPGMHLGGALAAAAGRSLGGAAGGGLGAYIGHGAEAKKSKAATKKAAVYDMALEKGAALLSMPKGLPGEGYMRRKGYSEADIEAARGGALGSLIPVGLPMSAVGGAAGARKGEAIGAGIGGGLGQYAGSAAGFAAGLPFLGIGAIPGAMAGGYIGGGLGAAAGARAQRAGKKGRGSRKQASASVEKVAHIYDLAYEEIEKDAGIATLGKAIGSGVKRMGLMGAKAGKSAIRSSGGHGATGLQAGASRLLHRAGTGVARAGQAMARNPVATGAGAVGVAGLGAGAAIGKARGRNLREY
jgi:hypothetical protein